MVAMTCYMTDTKNSAMALVPWLYPNSPPSDDPGITTKSSPFLLASQQYLARIPVLLINLQAVHVLEWHGIQ